MNHPAKYNDALMPIFEKWLQGCKILDPFAGTGKLFELLSSWPMGTRVFGVEIEYEWASMARYLPMSVGNALQLPFADSTFDAICTSPCYGNRMADHHNARDKSVRNTYTHILGHPLHEDNSGKLQWGKQYRAFHTMAWKESKRVLKPGGKFVLNVKDHIRHGEQQYVTWWHQECLKEMGFVEKHFIQVPLLGNRMGQNGELRMGYESVILFTLENK